MKISKGFTAIEGLLILVIVGVLAGVGWYVWDSHKKTSTTTVSTNISSTTSTKTSTPAADPTADWVTYTSKDKTFTVRAPKTWVPATNPDLCADSILLLGSSSQLVGTCASENAGQVEFVSTVHPCLPILDNMTTDSVMLNGTVGSKYTGTSVSENDANVYPIGTKAVIYCFRKADNNGFEAFYVQKKGDTDNLSTFNTMVTKTWKF